MSDKVETEDTRIVASAPTDETPVNPPTPLSEGSDRVGSTDDGPPTAGDVAALAAESVAAVGVGAVRSVVGSPRLSRWLLIGSEAVTWGSWSPASSLVY